MIEFIDETLVDSCMVKYWHSQENNCRWLHPDATTKGSVQKTGESRYVVHAMLCNMKCILTHYIRILISYIYASDICVYEYVILDRSTVNTFLSFRSPNYGLSPAAHNFRIPHFEMLFMFIPDIFQTRHTSTTLPPPFKRKAAFIHTFFVTLIIFHHCQRSPCYRHSVRAMFQCSNCSSLHSQSKVGPRRPPAYCRIHPFLHQFS